MVEASSSRKSSRKNLSLVVATIAIKQVIELATVVKEHFQREEAQLPSLHYCLLAKELVQLALMYNFQEKVE